ncbi:hypothetical protein ACC716_37685, partial [Rhizobium johnstonii]|uniref:hypothetical protein n=1 Tax=Rhizobium johnstonii TaxID=3019933 RepID=UPI003F9DF834
EAGESREVLVEGGGEGVLGKWVREVGGAGNGGMGGGVGGWVGRVEDVLGVRGRREVGKFRVGCGRWGEVVVGVTR